MKIHIELNHICKVENGNYTFKRFKNRFLWLHFYFEKLQKLL